MLVSTSVYAATDEPSGWATEGIEQLKDTGIFREEAFKNFKEDITRQEFIYLAVRIYETYAKKEIEIDPKIKFSDTDDIYALKGATVGITTGVGGGKFAPNAKLTREQLAVLMINTLDLFDIHMIENKDYKFVDENDFSSWAKDKIYLAKANNIIGGVGNDTFSSQGNATIEMALIIVWKIFKVDWEFGSDSRADGIIAHIIDIYPENGTDGQIENPFEHNFQGDETLRTIMSKYGPTDQKNVNDNVVTTNPNGFMYHKDTLGSGEFADIDVKVIDNAVKITYNAYNDTVKSMIVDFMNYTFKSKNGYSDAINRMFQDMDATKITTTSGKTMYRTSQLNGETVEVSDITIEYIDGGSFVVYLTINN